MHRSVVVEVEIVGKIDGSAANWHELRWKNGWCRFCYYALYLTGDINQTVSDVNSLEVWRSL